MNVGFTKNQLHDDTTFRPLNLIHGFNRETLLIGIDYCLPSEREARQLKQIISWRGKHEVIRYGRINRSHRIVHKTDIA